MEKAYINCENSCCIFNINKACIKEEITIKKSKNSKYGLCSNACLISVEEEKRLKKHLCEEGILELQEAIAQEKFKSENLQKQIDENNKIIEELHKEKENICKNEHKTETEILAKAREKAHPYKSGKGKTLKDLYSNTELEDMYIVQGMSLAAMTEITGVAKSTLWGRLKSIGAIDRKKAMESNYDLTESEKEV